MLSHLKHFSLVFVLAISLAACASNDAAKGGKAGSDYGDGATADGGNLYSGDVSDIPAGTQEDLVANVGDRVFFDTDSSRLDSNAQETLARQAEWLAANPTVTVTIEGHCDERGTREYNLALGDRRATAVRHYLISLGVEPNRISTISYGKERPVALGSNEVAWSKNRRSVTTVN